MNSVATHNFWAINNVYQQAFVGRLVHNSSAFSWINSWRVCGSITCKSERHTIGDTLAITKFYVYEVHETRWQGVRQLCIKTLYKSTLPRNESGLLRFLLWSNRNLPIGSGRECPAGSALKRKCKQCLIKKWVLLIDRIDLEWFRIGGFDLMRDSLSNSA